MKRILATILLSLGVSISVPSVYAEQMYRWVDKEGVTHFTREAPDESQLGESNRHKPDAAQLSAKEDYQRERASLENRLNHAIHDQKRAELRREILILDYNWYKDKDPAKAAELKQQLGEPKIRVIKKEQTPTNNMDRYKAFY